MLDHIWLNEFIIIIYTIAIIGYFIDFIQPNRKANRLAFWSLSMVWVLQTVFLFHKMLSEKSFPIHTIYDGLYFYTWILITFSLILHRFFRVDFFVFFTNIVGFFILVLHINTRIQYYSHIDPIEFEQAMLILHITLALISYGFFTFSFIFSIMYLFQYQLLKEKKWSSRLMRLGDLTKLDKLSYFSILVGLPTLLLAIILGVLWGYTSNDLFYWMDLKTIGSICVLVVYAVSLVIRIGKGLQGKKMATFNLYAFLILFINYFLFSTLSKFHF